MLPDDRTGPCCPIVGRLLCRTTAQGRSRSCRIERSDCWFIRHIRVAITHLWWSTILPPCANLGSRASQSLSSSKMTQSFSSSRPQCSPADKTTSPTLICSHPVLPCHTLTELTLAGFFPKIVSHRLATSSLSIVLPVPCTHARVKDKKMSARLQHGRTGVPVTSTFGTLLSAAFAFFGITACGFSGFLSATRGLACGSCVHPLLTAQSDFVGSCCAGLRRCC